MAKVKIEIGIDPAVKNGDMIVINGSPATPQDSLRNAVVASVTKTTPLVRVARHSFKNSPAHKSFVSRVLGKRNAMQKNQEAWDAFLSSTPELSYLKLSGQLTFYRGKPFLGTNKPFSLEDAFCPINAAELHESKFPNLQLNDSVYSYQPQRLPVEIQISIAQAVETGKIVAIKLSEQDYISVDHNNGSMVSDTPMMPDASFSQAISAIIKHHGITSDQFQQATHLNYDMFSKFKRGVQFDPKAGTCRAVLFLIRPTLKQAEDLLSLAGYSLTRSYPDQILARLICNRDFDIDKFNNIMQITGHINNKLGSKSNL